MNDASPDRPSPRLWRRVLPWCVLGVAIRLALLLLAGEPELQKDEANYVYLALGWSRFGFLGDAERFLWPPLWTWVLRFAMELFGRDGLFAAKLLLVFGSASVGASVMGIAARLGNVKAAHIAGALWALHLPLAAFTHMLWAEPLFLMVLAPAMYFLVVADQERGTRRGDRALFAAGLLLGVSLLVKESAVFLAPLLFVGLLWSARSLGWLESLRRSSLFLLSIIAVIVPWAVRNAEVYGHFTPSGLSLGENAFGGLNSHYFNFDVRPLSRLEHVTEPIENRARPAFATLSTEGWWSPATELTNTAERSSEQVQRGIAWVLDHPGEFLRTRVKKLADFVLPTCYYLRHQALGLYDGGLGSTLARRVTLVWSVLGVVGLLLLAVPGLLRAWRLRTHTSAVWIPILCAAYFASTCLLVSMSRFRLPMLPCLFVFAGLWLAAPRGERLPAGSGRIFLAGGWLVLLFLWWVDLPEFLAVLELTWKN